MFSRVIAECFPSEDLPVLFACETRECFYYETLFKPSEAVPKETYDPKHSMMVVQLRCPSCDSVLQEWSD